MDENDKQEDKVYIPAVKMIAAVKKRPPLYDLKTNVSNKEKLRLWKEVGAEVFEDWEELPKAGMYDRVAALQKRWRSFRDSYRREVKFRVTGNRKTARSYIHYNRLSFLRTPEEADVLGVNNINNDNDGGSEGDTDNYEEPYFEHDPSSRIVATKPILHQPNESPPPQSSVIVQKKRDEDTVDENGDKLFLLSFLNEMNQLPLHIKMWAKSQIANTMQEAIAKQYAEQKETTKKTKY